MIELENVTMTYPGGMTALKNVNINIEKGEFVFIVGSSGSGKTTLIKLLLKERIFRRSEERSELYFRISDC